MFFKELRALIGKYFLNAECKIVLVNKFTIGSFLTLKMSSLLACVHLWCSNFGAHCVHLHAMVQPAVCCKLELQSMLGGVIEHGLGWLKAWSHYGQWRGWGHGFFCYVADNLCLKGGAIVTFWWPALALAQIGPWQGPPTFNMWVYKRFFLVCFLSYTS